jgi:hypothetical protein
MKTQKSIKIKCGITLPAGLPVQFILGEPSRVLVTHDSRPEPYRVRLTSAFRQPSIRTLERWSNDGVCKTPSGHRVEPDGTGPDNSPSWLLALQLI